MKTDITFEQDVLQTQLDLYDKLAEIESLDETAMTILDTIMHFHDGDWVGILSVDFNMKLWKLRWWISKAGGPMGKTIFDPIEETEIFSRWEASLRKHEPIIIRDREEIKDTYPDEYYFLKENKLHSVIAIPFYQGSVGCILVRNPARYPDRSEFLALLWRVIADLIIKKNYENMVRDAELQEVNEEDNNIQINLLGAPNMKVYGRTITNCPVLAWEVIHYLHEKNNGPYNAKDLSNTLRPQRADHKRAPRTLRDNLSELTEAFDNAYPGKEPLIFSNHTGFWMNSSLKITYDYELFQQHINRAKFSKNIYEKLEHLKNAINLYRGPLFDGKADGPSRFSDGTELNVAFMSTLEEFLRLLLQIECFDVVARYAAKGLSFEHAYPKFHAAKYVAEMKLHQRNTAWDTLNYAKSVLDAEERQEMAGFILLYIPDWNLTDLLINDDFEEFEDA